MGSNVIRTISIFYKVNVTDQGPASKRGVLDNGMVRHGIVDGKGWREFERRTSGLIYPANHLNRLPNAANGKR